ncbi:MAG: hypothetical protein ACC631_04805 [Halocynthiibacter sp.]
MIAGSRQPITDRRQELAGPGGQEISGRFQNRQLDDVAMHEPVSAIFSPAAPA